MGSGSGAPASAALPPSLFTIAAASSSRPNERGIGRPLLPALVGSGVPDAVRRKFEDEIAGGRTLLVVDVTRREQPFIAELMAATSDHHLLWQSDSDQAAAA